MILSSDPKKMAAMIMIKKGEGEGEKLLKKEVDGAEPDLDPGLIAAGDEMLSALEKKDSVAFAKSLKDFVSMCGSYSESEE